MVCVNIGWLLPLIGRFSDFQIFVLFSVVRPEDPGFKLHSKVRYNKIQVKLKNNLTNKIAAQTMDQRSMDRKLRSLTIVYSTNAANGPICAKFRTQISLNIPVTSVKLRAFLVDE